MSSEELLNLKYSDLQKLAKNHGIKANQKSEKLIEALKLIITSKEKTSKEIVNEGNGSKNVDESKLVDIGPENKANTSSTKRKRSSASRSRQNSAKKSPKKKTCSTPEKGKDKSPIPPDNFPASPKKASSTRKLTPPKDEGIESPDVVQVSSASKNTRSSRRKENPENDSVEEKQHKKRSRESSEVEEQFEPMRKRLRSSMEAKEPVANENGKTATKQTTSIPRYSKLLKAQKKTAEYWSKMHQRNQEKLESIDEYQKKKQTRAAVLLSGRKKDKARTAGVLGSRSSPRLTAVVKPLTSKIFVPEVLTTDKMDLDFGKKASTSRKNSPGNPQNNTFTKDKSPGFRTPRNPRDSPASKNVGSNLKVSMFSPKAMNASVLSASKPKFDLAKSLERPLTWVPYKGRIRPIEEEKNRHRVDVKEVKTRSRQQRAAEAKSGWKSRRDSELMRKRGAK